MTVAMTGAQWNVFYVCVFVSLVMLSPALGVMYVQPEQVHIAYGVNATQMTITWVTQNVTESVVKYGTDSLQFVAKGSGPDKFVDGGQLHRIMWIHRVTLIKLQPATKYMYHVGSDLGWSNIYTFTAMKSGVNWSPRFAVFGDMGNKNAVIMSSLQEAAQSQKFDAVLHVGDFAYDLATDNARIGDAFMNQIESVAGYVPYMVCVGNHENAYNFSNYKARFSMPNGHGDNLFYSFDIGPAHIIAVSTEVYYFYDYEKYGGILTAVNQMMWLEKDLKEANKAENRAQRPWIIVIGHRPMYCSNSDGPTEHCNNLNNNTVRTGFPGMPFLGLEDVFYKYGVDLMFFAHEHSYERLWPVYNLTVCNGTTSPYTDPRAPVHIVTGSGGNEEGQTPFDHVKYPWSGFHTDDFGYTEMTIHNASHLELQQVSVNLIQPNRIVDEMMLVKSRHGAGIYTCHQKN